MKTISAGYSFGDILKHLAQQNPEEKLRSAFRLNTFVKKLHEAGLKDAKTNQRHRSGRTA